MEVPRAITALHNTISHSGIWKLVTLSCPLARKMPSMKTPINFWPSCAPCMNAIAAPPAICAPPKKPVVRRRSMFLHRNSTSLAAAQPNAKPSRVDRTRPYRTLIHSPPLMPAKPPCSAMAAPDSPAIRAWLSLVGMPNHQAAVAHATMATSAAHSAVSASAVLPPKSTML